MLRLYASAVVIVTVTLNYYYCMRLRLGMWRQRQNTHNEDPIELNWNDRMATIYHQQTSFNQANGHFDRCAQRWMRTVELSYWLDLPADQNHCISISNHYFAFAHSTVGVMFQYQIQLQRLVDSVEILERVSVLNCLLGLLKIQAICVNDSFCDKTIQINIFRLNCSESFKSIFHLISNCLWPNDWCNMKSDRGKVP